ncbi:MAG: phosphate ABC transporter substrate-binding protein [Oscillospiraceae bacterium]|nr:phosphate ABC transporter substrate-binding protein [Oscillospiraceae bacterium]
MKFIAILLLAVLLCSCGPGTRSAVVVAGSTSVQPYAEVLAEEYAKRYPGRDVDIQGGGSSAGIRAAQSGTADIGMSSRGLSGDELQMWSAEIARDGLAMIVHPNNALDSLTPEEVRAVYTGRVTNWGELGGPEGRIHVITREEGSGTRGAFEDMLMEGQMITLKAIVQNTNGSVRQLVSNDASSIGFISLGLVDDTVKALQLDGVEATGENVTNGSYMLFRPFIFVSEGEPDGSVMQFIEFTMSPEGQAILAGEGLVSSGEVARR